MRNLAVVADFSAEHINWKLQTNFLNKVLKVICMKVILCAVLMLFRNPQASANEQKICMHIYRVIHDTDLRSAKCIGH